MRRRTPVIAALVAGLLACLVACTSGGGSSDASPPPGRPVTGVCHTYDAKAADAPTETGPTVPCTGKHTAETLVVRDTLPVPNADGTWTEDQLSIAGATVCGDAIVAEKLGRTQGQLASTRISRAFFAPTAAQAEAGARWVRCDVLVLDRGDPVLVTGSLVGQVDVSGAFARCTKSPPAAEFDAIRCREGRGLYASVGAVPIPANAPPAAGAFQAALVAACQKAFASVATGPDAWIATAPEQTSPGVTGTDALCWLPVAEWNVDSARWPAESPLRTTTEV